MPIEIRLNQLYALIIIHDIATNHLYCEELQMKPPCLEYLTNSGLTKQYITYVLHFKYTRFPVTVSQCLHFQQSYTVHQLLHCNKLFKVRRAGGGGALLAPRVLLPTIHMAHTHRYFP